MYVCMYVCMYVYYIYIYVYYIYILYFGLFKNVLKSICICIYIQVIQYKLFNGKKTTFLVKYFSLQLSSVTYICNKIEILIHDICYSNY